MKQVVEVLRVPEIGRINSQNLAGLAREKDREMTGSVPAESVPTFSAGARRASDERRKML